MGEIFGSDDNKTAVYGMMDKIGFDREKYRLGHTKVFFKAGALALLEEMRDDIVLKLIRWMQGRTYGFIKREWVYQRRWEQRNLIKVIQANFRKYFMLKSWGWFQVIQRTKPLIGQLNMEEALANLEARVKETYGAYMEQLDTKNRLEEENKQIMEEKKQLVKQLESEQGNLSEYTDRQEKAQKAKLDLEIALKDAGERLIDAEARRVDATQALKEMGGENTVIKKDIEDLEIAIVKLEQEKCNRDHIIRHLNDEIANQDEIINKLNKEKKLINENAAKANEDLQVAQDKVDHLSKIKTKLEVTLDELNDSLAREKRAGQDIQKQRRKVEGELRVFQESVGELERAKKEIEQVIIKKDKEFSMLANKLDDEQANVSKSQKGIKEVSARVEELEEELEAERQARAKAEKQRSDL